MRLRLDRWGDDPVLGESGEPVVVKTPTTRDLDAFQLLDPDRYHFLSAPFLAAFLDADPRVIRKRLKILQRQPNRYLDLHSEAQKRWIGLNGHQFYARGEKARDTLRDRGLAASTHGAAGHAREFPHQIGIDTGLASIDLGIRRAGNARMVYPREIIEHEEFPAETRKSDSPLTIKVSISKKFDHGKTHEKAFHYRNDGLRAIKYDSGEWLFINFEFEHTNRVDSSNFNTTSFLQKFLAVQYIREHGLFEKRWGIPQEFVMTLVLAPHQVRIDTMKALIMRETMGKGCKYIAFHTFPCLDETPCILPMPELYTSPWQRAGRTDFKLTEV